MTDRYYGYDTKTYTAQVAGHGVALEFDKKLLVLNRARLFVDDELVDSAKVFYGDKTLATDLADDIRIEVIIDSGGAGELTRAQVREGTGAWVDLQESAA